MIKLERGFYREKIICVVCVLMMCLMLAGCDSSQYKKATSLYKAGEYEAATAIFEELAIMKIVLKW